MDNEGKSTESIWDMGFKLKYRNIAMGIVVIFIGIGTYLLFRLGRNKCGRHFRRPDTEQDAGAATVAYNAQGQVVQMRPLLAPTTAQAASVVPARLHSGRQ